MTKKVTVKFARQQITDLKMEILNAIDNMHLSAMTITGSTCFAGNILDRVTLEKQVKSCYRHVNALTQKYWKLVEIIARSDATTYIEIPSGKMTIARARMMKDEIEQYKEERFTRRIIRKLNYEYVTTYVSNPTYEPLKKAFFEMKESIHWFLSDKDTELLDTIEEFFSQYKNVYWDPLNINGELMKYIMYENMILHSMEYLICISDDHTYVEIDC